MTAIPLPNGQFTVPGNRWDLLVDVPARPVRVTVVVVYYDQQRELDLVLTALEAQDYPADRLDVVVADDGSSRAPAVTTTRLPVRVVRQADRGFRAAAARNLGAAGTTAEVLCFLDADTVPQPDYIRRLVALPSLCPEALVVGRRRHADLSAWTPQQLRRWWRGADPPDELEEPPWLTAEYTRTGNLLTIDQRSYRYLISSVMCCSTMLFRELGGFDESFDQYGGEDWEFAHRAITAGAVVKHQRDAVAWHNGPDWAGRGVGERARVKNAETLAVARLIPDPELRLPGLVYEIPRVAARIDAAGHGTGSLLATIGCFMDLDVGVWVSGDGAAELLDSLRLSDPRIHLGDVPDVVLCSCAFVIEVTGRAVLPRAAVAELIHRCDGGGAGLATVRHAQVSITCAASWARHRAHRWRGRRLCDPTDIARFGMSITVAGSALELREVEPDHPC